MEPGKPVVVGKKVMALCGRCGKVVTFKPLLGSKHLCVR